PAAMLNRDPGAAKSLGGRGTADHRDRPAPDRVGGESPPVGVLPFKREKKISVADAPGIVLDPGDCESGKLCRQIRFERNSGKDLTDRHKACNQLPDVDRRVYLANITRIRSPGGRTAPAGA